MLENKRVPSEVLALKVILFGIMAVILFSGYDVFMHKLGFESKMSLRAELKTTQSSLETVTRANESLKRELKREREERKIASETITQLKQDQVSRERVAANVKLERDVKIQKLRVASTAKVLPVRKPTDVMVIKPLPAPQDPISPLEDLEGVSEANIQALQSLHSQLFHPLTKQDS